MKDILVFILMFACIMPVFSATQPNVKTDKLTTYKLDKHNPFIIAHRGGAADGPENTIPTIEASLANGADIIWITVQLSKDGIPVLYRPSDLSILTNITHSAAVSSMNVQELTALDAGVQFFQSRTPPLGITYHIPRLSEVLSRFPHTQFFIDLKSPDAVTLEYIEKVAQVIKQTHAEDRVRLYSTSEAYVDAVKNHTSLKAFQSRAETRDILFSSKLSNQCEKKSYMPGWHAFELTRNVEIVEHFMLGEGRTQTTFRWSKSDLQCFKAKGNTLVLIGVNSKEDYQYAKGLGVYAVMVDSPKAAQCYDNDTDQLTLCTQE